MRAVTFNIHHGVNGDGRLNLESIAETIESLHADVVGMQEVDRRFAERSGFVDQARMLSRRLGMRLAYGAALNLEPADQNEPDADTATRSWPAIPSSGATTCCCRARQQ